MVKEIVKDIKELQKVSKTFNKAKDSQVITDLLDTAKAHAEDCAGLAAVQIGYLVKAFVVKNPKTEKFQVFINPFILKRSTETYETEEGCLSLDGLRKVIRHDWVEVIYNDRDGKYTKERLTGLKAEVFQHEFDHLMGKLI